MKHWDQEAFRFPGSCPRRYDNVCFLMNGGNNRSLLMRVQRSIRFEKLAQPLIEKTLACQLANRLASLIRLVPL
jgi:hypothetical protein